MTFGIKSPLRRNQLEGWFWLTAITLLAFSDPDHHDHFSLCLFSLLGIDFCPGCGLGHSIALLFRLRIWESVCTHPLGIPAVVILLHRSYSLLLYPFITIQKSNHHEPHFQLSARD